MPSELKAFFDDLDLDELRIRRPNKFIFFCGGKISTADDEACTLRHYLLRDRKVGEFIQAHVVLAETANQLYRDSGYRDLITFEEDIARISAMVLVIVESAGSVAELGAFSAIPTIQRLLAILVQTKYSDEESFIRYGPIERINSADEGRVGFFPWEVDPEGRLLKDSVRDHVEHITQFINDLLTRIPREELWRNLEDMQFFILIYWIVHLSFAIRQKTLLTYLQTICPNFKSGELQRKLYVMRIAGWIEKHTYGGYTYFYATSPVDPFKYALKNGVVERDSIRRKAEVSTAIQAELKLPMPVKEFVADKLAATDAPALADAAEGGA